MVGTVVKCVVNVERPGKEGAEKQIYDFTLCAPISHYAFDIFQQYQEKENKSPVYAVLLKSPSLGSQSYGFSSSHVWMCELDHKES